MVGDNVKRLRERNLKTYLRAINVVICYNLNLSAGDYVERFHKRFGDFMK